MNQKVKSIIISLAIVTFAFLAFKVYNLNKEVSALEKRITTVETNTAQVIAFINQAIAASQQKTQ